MRDTGNVWRPVVRIIVQPQLTADKNATFGDDGRSVKPQDALPWGSAIVKISLKWLLIVVTYVAVALAACMQQGAIWLAVLWVASVLAVLVALLASAFFRGRSQAAAAGFALFAIAYGAAAITLPACSPVAVVVQVVAPKSIVTSDELTEAQERVARLEWELMVAANSASDDYRQRAQQEYQAAQKRLRNSMSFESLVESLEAISVIIAGFIGSLVGSHVWKVGQKQKG